MKASSPAILVATVLIFVARALEFKRGGDILDCVALAALFAVISFGLNFVIRLFRSKATTDVSTEWTSYLLFGWIISLVLVILDNLLNILIDTPPLPLFLESAFIAAIVYSVLAIAVTFAKTYKFDHKRLSYPAAYLVCAVFLNSVLLYAFVFAGT